MRVLSNRKSVVSFDKSKLVAKEVLEKIFLAASLAPSAMNLQPWQYYYAFRGTAGFTKIFNTLAEGNQRWAKDATVLILSVALVRYEHNGKTIENKYAWHDTGMANIQLMLQAVELGLVSHPMGGFDSEKLISELDLAVNHEPVVIIALGHPGDETVLDPDLLERLQKPKSRKPISFFSFLVD